MLARLLVFAFLSLPATVAGAAPASRLEPDDLAGPPLEVVTGSAAVTAPPVPSFELPSAGPGRVSPRQLRLRGRRWLDTEVRVVGYVTWIYDCAAQLQQQDRKLSRARAQRKIDLDPSVCEIPKLALGDRADASREDSITVVEVPRAPSKLERKRLPRAELAAWPTPPRLAVGDRVELTGQWALRAPRGDADVNGLLVFRAVAAAASGPEPASSPEPASAAEPEPQVVTQAPLRPVVEPRVRAASLVSQSTCTRAFAQGQHQEAIAACEQAVRTWPGNHLAWYIGASAHMARGEWPAARAAVERAVTLRPDLAMYQLYHGVALYEEALALERQTQAARSGRSPAEVSVSSVPGASAALPAAQVALRRAAKLAPALWRAHVYLARVSLDLDEPRRAAQELAAVLRTHPTYAFGYFGLVDLYRRWGYLDQAAEVARLGTAQLAAPEAAELWLQLGLIEEARGGDLAALAAYDHALALRAELALALLRRGQLHHRRGDRASAQRDLRAVLASREPGAAALAPFASRLLQALETKAR